MNGIGLDKLTWRRHKWAAWVIPADSWPPSAVKAVVTAENPPHAAQANGETKSIRDVVPDDFGATL